MEGLKFCGPTLFKWQSIFAKFIFLQKTDLVHVKWPRVLVSWVRIVKFYVWPCGSVSFSISFFYFCAGLGGDEWVGPSKIFAVFVPSFGSKEAWGTLGFLILILNSLQLCLLSRGPNPISSSLYHLPKSLLLSSISGPISSLYLCGRGGSWRWQRKEYDKEAGENKTKTEV